jgi:hypothetical protein
VRKSEVWSIKVTNLPSTVQHILSRTLALQARTLIAGGVMIAETIRIGCCFYEDLALTPDIKSVLINDHSLSKDEFAVRHAETIQLYYAKTLRMSLLSEDAYFFAHCVREYLDSLALQAECRDIRIAEPSLERLH